LPRLLKTHKGQYVAISQGRIIDSDADDFALVDRVGRRLPDQRVRIQKVIEGGLEDFYIDTPGFEFCDARGA
jgi:hypothetical protein